MIGDLTVAAQTGDHRAADQLVRRHTGLAYTIAGDYYLPGADQDDTRQEALIGLYVAIVSYQPEHRLPFPQFAALVIRRRTRDAVTRANRRKNLLLSDALRIVTLDSGTEADAVDLADTHANDPAAIAEANADLGQLITAVRYLSALERRALIGIATGHTYREIATGGRNIGKQIDNAAHRARVKLRTLLDAA